MDHSPPASSVHGILQARTLAWVAIPFCRESFWPRTWTWVSCIAGRLFTVWVTIHMYCTFFLLVSTFVVVGQLLNHVWLFVTPWTAAHQASLAFTISPNLLKFISIKLVMPSNHLIFCHFTVSLLSISIWKFISTQLMGQLITDHWYLVV